MSQHDMDVANGNGITVRADINSALQALVSTSSGAVEPATIFANMLWYDSASNQLKMRNEADDAWIIIGDLNQVTDSFIAAAAATTALDESSIVQLQVFS